MSRAKPPATAAAKTNAASQGSHHDRDLRPDILTTRSEGSVEAEPDAGTLEAP